MIRSPISLPEKNVGYFWFIILSKGLNILYAGVYLATMTKNYRNYIYMDSRILVQMVGYIKRKFLV